MLDGTLHLLILLVACGDSTAPATHGNPAPPPAPVFEDPFERVSPEELRPTLDSAFTECDGGAWSVLAEVAGRAHSARAVVVRTEGPAFALEVPLVSAALPEGSLWQRWESKSDAAVPCSREHTATVISAFDANGATVDCVAFGSRAAELVAGSIDDRLGEVPPGDWADCRVR